MKKIILLDPGHGLSNRRAGVYDSGTTFGDLEEATIAMDWVNVLRDILLARGCEVIRTRRNAKDPAPVASRAYIARTYATQIMLCLHCNEGGGKATGPEAFYRGSDNKAPAAALAQAVATALGLKSRGAKTEKESQHPRLAVMSFQPCFLLELGFLDNATDRAAMIDPVKRLKACQLLADLITA